MPSKPSWLKIRPPTTEQYSWIKSQVGKQQLHTVCQEAHCPNMTECWSAGTASFLILGDTCTRNCRFCAVKTRRNGIPVDEKEPQKLAKTIQEMKLKYVVVTSVDRDDLKDHGARQFADCIQEIKKLNPKTKIEVLTPDFCGKKESIETVLNAKPDVFGHNLETVQRLQKKVRDRRANYEQSLEVLRIAKEIASSVYTKSALMLGMGENNEEILEAMEDLRKTKVDLLSLGQYLQPSPNHYPVHRFVTPTEFVEMKSEALKKGFLYCQSGPLVRSSFKAGDFFIKQ